MIRFVLLCAALLSVAGCAHDSSPAPAGGQPPAAEQTSATAPVVIDSQMLNRIKLQTVEAHEVPRALTVAGKVQFDEDRLAHVLAPLAGQIIDLHVKVGDVVRQGQVLGAISSREAAAALGEHVEGHKDLDLAEKTAAMTADLFEHEAASKMSLQQAQNDLAKAQARVARSEQALRMLGLDESLTEFNGRVPIRSPLGGTVIERRVTNGQFVQTDGTPIITVGDVSEVWVVGDVFEQDLRDVRVGQSAIVTTTAYPGQPFRGTVNYISNALDPATRTAKVRVTVRNPRGWLKPEMFASVTVGVGEHEQVLTVPARATFTEDGRTYVYTEVSAGRFVRRAIEIGADAGENRRVLTGLHGGEKVVVDGALLLRQEEDKRAG